MWKKILCIIYLIVILPVFSGEYEDAVSRGDRIFLYMYTPHCGYCVKLPYVLIVNPRKNETKRITPQCLLNYACINDALDRFVE